MLSFHQLKQYVQHRLFFSVKEREPVAAYNLWCESYDSQPDNLVLALDESVFTGLLKEVSMRNKIVADIGCGTGRHWQKMMEQNPEKLIGFDVSQGMLNSLRQKYPHAETYLLKNNFLNQLENESCDIIVSTLALAHIKEMGQVLKEWNRVLKTGGDLIITDYHPSALINGGDRTFKYKNKLVAIKNHIHTIQTVRTTAKLLNWQEINFTEEIIDEPQKHYYEKQNAISVYEKFKNMPIIYGIHFKKNG